MLVIRSRSSSSSGGSMEEGVMNQSHEQVREQDAGRWKHLGSAGCPGSCGGEGEGELGERVREAGLESSNR